MKYCFYILFLLPAVIFAQPIQSDSLSNPQPVKTKFPKIRVAAQVGYGYRNAYLTQSTYLLGPVSASMKNHLLKLNHNISYGADFSYYFINILGVGLRYNGINTRVSSSNVLFPFEDGSYVRGNISEKVSIHYLGFFVATRYFLPSQKHCFFANIGAGYVDYKNNLKIKDCKQTLRDDSAGFVAEFGYDFLVTENFAIGLQASLFFGSLKYYSYIIENGNIKLGKSTRQPRRLNLNHIDISLGFRFYK